MDMLENIKDFIITELKNRSGERYYLCDIGMELSSNENCNGSWYCSTYKAEEEVKENWDFCKSFFEYYKNEFGTCLNPFDTENFHCVMMICAVQNAFNLTVNEIDELTEFWNDKIEINDEFISKIETGLQNLELDDIF